MMNEKELYQLIGKLIGLPKEREWVEFKESYYKPDEIGEYISALANAACLHKKETGYLVFGVENETHEIKGTTFTPHKSKVGNEELENWLAHLLTPRIDFRIVEHEYYGHALVLFIIDAAHNLPVRFKGVEYIRVGSYKKKLADHPEKARKIWKSGTERDWSAGICKGATSYDLDPLAISKARQQYKKKFPHLAAQITAWDDITFLNKAKITIQDKITRTAIILLGREESEHFISPSVAKISWILKDEQGIEKDYEHFGPPFILHTDTVLSKIRNLRYRHLPDQTLFPIEITQYEPYVIREALHNCIAHQDYRLKGRMLVIERADEIHFTNVGTFIPVTVEAVIEQDAPQAIYRNPFLASAMVNLNMIDTIGSGIKKMFMMQKNRYFPLPTYMLDKQEEVTVKIPGKILDVNYTRLLINDTELAINTVILLDKVQKKGKISQSELYLLKKQKLVEGRYPNIFVVSKIAAITGDKSTYIKYRAFDDQHYKDMVIAFIKKYGSASRREIDELLFEKLSDALSENQKRNKIRNLIYAMSKRDQSIYNAGTSKKSKWVIA